MINRHPYLPRRFGLGWVGGVALVVAIFSGCGAAASPSTTTGSTSVPAAIPPALYTLVEGASTGSGGTPPNSVNAYDDANGHLRFAHALAGSAIAMVTTQHLLGITSIVSPTDSTQSPHAFLTVLDANGTQTQQIALGSLTPEQVLASPTAIFVGVNGKGSTPAQFSAYDPTTGTQLWQHAITDANGIDNFVLVGQDLIGNVGNASGTLLKAFDVATGAQVWQSTGSVGGAAGHIGASDDAIYSVEWTSSPGEQTLIAQTATSGVKRWSISVADQPQILAADHNAVYCTVFHTISSTESTTMLTAFAASDGHPLWSVPETLPIRDSATIMNAVLYAAGTGPSSATSAVLPPSTLFAVNVATGATLWQKPLAGPAITAPTIVGNTVSIGMATNVTSAAPQGDTAIATFHLTDGAASWQIQTGVPSLNELVTLP